MVGPGSVRGWAGGPLLRGRLDRRGGLPVDGVVTVGPVNRTPLSRPREAIFLSEIDPLLVDRKSNRIKSNRVESKLGRAGGGRGGVIDTRRRAIIQGLV